jgi:prepilin-type N-terminal cleavage/methylation domain-containing protein
VLIRSGRGFTLVEVLISLALTLVVLFMPGGLVQAARLLRAKLVLRETVR